MLMATEKKPLSPIFNQKARLHFIHRVNVSSLSLDMGRFAVYSTNCRYLNYVQLLQSSRQSPTPQSGQITFCYIERRIDHNFYVLLVMHTPHPPHTPYGGEH